MTIRKSTILLGMLVVMACDTKPPPQDFEKVEKAVPTASEDADGSPAERSEKSVGEIASISLVELKKKGTLQTLKVVEASVVEDPAYKTDDTFRGYRLDDIIAIIPGMDEIDWTAHEIRMIASDGYTVAVPKSQLTPNKGVLAFTHDKAPKGKPWGTFLQGKREITPAPFYLVWDGIPYGPSHPWPYQLERISVVNLDVAYENAFPKHAPEVLEGFSIYKQRCLSCHSVNLMGGTLGPEMNVPKNITTYRDREFLVGFIRNPADYRTRSAMPAFMDLSDSDIDKILRYLGAMKTAQICKSAAECAAVKE